jgi:hypothetical protein
LAQAFTDAQEAASKHTFEVLIMVLIRLNPSSHTHAQEIIPSTHNANSQKENA